MSGFDPSRLVESIRTSVDQGMASASVGLRAAAGEGAALSARAQEMIETGLSHLSSTFDTVDAAVISSLKEGILYGVDHQLISAASVSAAVLLGVPVLRRGLWRATFGRLTSQEELLKRSESRLASMMQDLDLQKNEIEKLGERLALAQEEYARGKSKLVAAAREMRALGSRVGKSEEKAKGLLYETRGIRSKGALQARSDAAVVVEAAKAQRRRVEKICWKLDANGM